MKKNLLFSALFVAFMPFFNADIPDIDLKATDGKTYNLKTDFAVDINL